MKYYLLSATITISLLLFACRANDNGSEEQISDFELKHGIGPVTSEIDLSEIAPELASKGEQLFQVHCTACHQLESQITGPALGGITENRTPAYIMNYILNPREMRERHPEAQRLSEQYPGVMVEMGLDEDDARAIVAFLAKYAAD